MSHEFRVLPIVSLRPFPGNKIIFKPFDPEQCENDRMLVTSVKRHGILCPPVVSKVAGQNDYMILSGHRRIAAAELSGQSTVMCRIMPPASGDIRRSQWLSGNLIRKMDDATMCRVLAENREDLLKEYDANAREAVQTGQPAATKRPEEKLAEITGHHREKTEAMLVVGNTLIAAEKQGDTETVQKIETALESTPVVRVAKQLRDEGVAVTPSGKKQNAKAEKVDLDQAGHPIPKHLIETFDIRERFNEITKASIALQKMITALVQTKPPGTELFNEEAAKVHLRNFQAQLRYAVPYAVCQSCKGTGKESGELCKPCKGTGWLGETSFKQAPADLRVIKK